MEDMISMYKQRTSDALDRFLLVLSFVPEDKLTWRPTPTAKSALQIAAHCAGYSGGFVGIIRTGKFPSTVEEFLGPIESAIKSVTTVEEAEAMLRKGTADTLAALDSVKPEQIGSIVDAPHAPAPFTFFLNIPAHHLYTHSAQIDYLQTCWDDQVVHF